MPILQFWHVDLSIEMSLHFYALDCFQTLMRPDQAIGSSSPRFDFDVRHIALKALPV